MNSNNIEIKFVENPFTGAEEKIAVRPKSTDRNVVECVIRGDCYKVKDIYIGTEDPLIVDLGAHIGSFSKMCLMRWPCAHIQAYEAHPINYGFLAYNLRHSTHTCHLGAVQGKVLRDRWLVERGIDDAKNEFGGWNICQRNNGYRPDGDREVGIETRFLDAEKIMAIARATSRSVIVKIDIEAAEWHVFDRWSDETWESIDWLVGELHLDAFNLDYYAGSTSPWEVHLARLKKYFEVPEALSEVDVKSGQLIEFCFKRKGR